MPKKNTQQSPKKNTKKSNLLKEGKMQKGGKNTEPTPPPKELRPKKAPPKKRMSGIKELCEMLGRLDLFC